MEQLPQITLYEQTAWKNLVVTNEWKVFVKLLDAHRQHLQKEVNSYLRKHEDRKASEALRAMDDCQKIIALVREQLEFINRKEQHGSGD